MTIEDFIKVIHPDTVIKVFDDLGYIGRYDSPELSIIFGEYTRIKEMKAREYNIIGIKI